MRTTVAVPCESKHRTGWLSACPCRLLTGCCPVVDRQRRQPLSTQAGWRRQIAVAIGSRTEPYLPAGRMSGRPASEATRGPVTRPESTGCRPRHPTDECVRTNPGKPRLASFTYTPGGFPNSSTGRLPAGRTPAASQSRMRPIAERIRSLVPGAWCLVPGAWRTRSRAEPNREQKPRAAGEQSASVLTALRSAEPLLTDSPVPSVVPHPFRPTRAVPASDLPHGSPAHRSHLPD